MGALAALRAVSKRFGERTALDSLTLEVRPGEVLGLVGPNGAGKTTALRLLCGLIGPDSGRVELAGHDLAQEPLEARKKVGYVPDGAPLYAQLTPNEHLKIVGGLHGLDPDSVRAEADRLLQALGLAERANDPVGGYSRGMRQKAAIACALLPRPPLLVMDEPLTGLDAPTTQVVKALLRGWADRGGAVLYTSHLLEVVERVCDRVAVLAAGRLVGLGSLEDLRAQAGGGGDTLEEIFRALAPTEDPVRAAERILGPSSPIEAQ